MQISCSWLTSWVERHCRTSASDVPKIRRRTAGRRCNITCVCGASGELGSAYAPGADLIDDKPEEFQAIIDAELQRYAKVAGEANMELQ
jgi:hypothetical protein